MTDTKSEVKVTSAAAASSGTKVTVIGAGLAGSEAAWQLAERGIPVEIREMRPEAMTPAHKTGDFAELVCSNSLRGASLANAVGLLKEEMRRFNSLIMKAAALAEVPAGGALAVDRHQFSGYITETLLNHPLITVIRDECSTIPDGFCILATGPLTSPRMSESLRSLLGKEYFYFYDAAAPIVTTESLDYSIVFKASRYDKGEGTYLNCPFDKDNYQEFWRELVGAAVAESHLPEEKAIFFEGCMPVEVLAKRGVDTLRFGPLKPVGLVDPVSGRRPYAVVQLRPEDRENRLFNLVGFQTHLKWGEQQRVFRMIPGLRNAEFARFGVMHRNTYVNAPQVLTETWQTRVNPSLFLAGQMTGVEGYVESAASGLAAGINCARLVCGELPLVFPAETAIGALASYICHADPRYFQPMNINFGLFPSLSEHHHGKKERQTMYSERSLSVLDAFKLSHRL